jgi:uncharacterized membrane protein
LEDYIKRLSLLLIIELTAFSFAVCSIFETSGFKNDVNYFNKVERSGNGKIMSLYFVRQGVRALSGIVLGAREVRG